MKVIICGNLCTVISLRKILDARYVKRKHLRRKKVTILGNTLASWRKLDKNFTLKNYS